MPELTIDDAELYDMRELDPAEVEAMTSEQRNKLIVEIGNECSVIGNNKVPSANTIRNFLKLSAAERGTRESKSRKPSVAKKPAFDLGKLMSS